MTCEELATVSTDDDDDVDDEEEAVDAPDGVVAGSGSDPPLPPAPPPIECSMLSDATSDVSEEVLGDSTRMVDAW